MSKYLMGQSYGLPGPTASAGPDRTGFKCLQIAVGKSGQLLMFQNKANTILDWLIMVLYLSAFASHTLLTCIVAVQR